MMKCRHVDRELPSYREGTLPPRIAKQVEQHLESCGRCRAELASLERLIALSRDALSPRTATASHPGRRWGETSASRTPLARGWKRRPIPRWRMGFALSAAACILVIALLRSQPISAGPQEDFEKALQTYDGAFTVAGQERRQRLRESLDLFREFLERHPDDAHYGAVALLFTADCYRQSGQANKAAFYYETVVEKFGGDTGSVAEARAALLTIYLNDLEDYSRGEALLSQLLDDGGTAPHAARFCVETVDRYRENDPWKAADWCRRTMKNPALMDPLTRQEIHERYSGLYNRIWESSFVTDWWIIGPFSDQGRYRFSHAHPPEKEIDLAKSYQGAKGEVRWQQITDPPNGDRPGHVNLDPLIGPEDYMAGYALTYLHAPEEQRVQFMLGSDDSIRFWLNDELIHSNPATRGAYPDNDATEFVFLKMGWNKILLRVADNGGHAWGFYFRAADTDLFPIPVHRFSPLKALPETGPEKTAASPDSGIHRGP